MSVADGPDSPVSGRAERDPQLGRIAERTSGTSLAEHVGQFASRLSWRTPLHRLRLRGRYPLKLIDVPADPIPGSARAGRALLEGRLLFGGEAASLDALDRRGWSAAYDDHLQSFAWVRDLAAAANRAEGSQLAEALMRRWLAKHAVSVGDPAWRPELWGRRILFWAAYAPFFLSNGDDAYRKEVLNTLARGARHLDRAADTAPNGFARVSAWAGVIAAGLLIPGGDLRVGHGEAGIARALGLATHDDGGLVSRVPAEQLALVELLAQLRAVYEVRARPPSGAVARAISHAVPALAAVTLGDGALSSWQAGGPAGAARVSAAIAVSGVRPAPRGEARDWGYQRLQCGQAVLVMDVAPPPVGALARNSGASTLAFELSDGARRLVVNCGGAPGLPHALAQGLRTTAAHSTLVLADANSTALHDDGTMGRGVSEVEWLRSLVEAGQRIEAAHDGYLRRFGFTHRRRVTLAASGEALEGEDRLVPAGRRRGATGKAAALRFHLGRDVEAVLTADGQGALLRPGEGEPWQFRTRLGALALEESLWVDGGGRPRAVQALAVALDVPPTGVTIPWSFRRARP